MESLRKIFALSSIVFLIVLALSPFKEYFREWKGYQKDYNALVSNLPKRVTPASIGIKQLWIRKFDRVDRCVTCHLGIKEEALRNAKQPFATHPQMYHDVEDFGCTLCHEGQGAATEYKESIGKVKFWDRPILPAEFMEASCAKCHKERNVPQAPILTMGRRILEESNCVGCHTLQGYQKQWIPPLDGIGSKVNRAWLVSWLKNPKASAPRTRMPNFLLAEEDVNNLADFLLTFKDLQNGSTLKPVPALLTSVSDQAKAKMTELGSTRFREARCISCHTVNGKGGYVANELGKVASKDSKEWLYNYIRDPRYVSSDVAMPRFRLPENELAGMIAYIESEFVDFELEAQPDHRPDPAFYEKGLALFKKNNCNGCHELSAARKSEESAPELSLIGSKKSYEIDFGKTSIDQTISSYIRTKLATPRVFSPAMKMPDYQFTAEEIRALTVALLGNTDEQIPAEYIVRPKQTSTFVPQGEFGKLVKDLSCTSCHVMNGLGRLVATDLSMEASQAQRKWIEGYFKVPYTLRPILTERMPNFYLSQTEIKTLTDYMESVFVVDSLHREIPNDAATTAKGRGLYFEKYACQSCHQIAGKGGYVGPPLDKISARLQGGWIFHWLKDPQAFKPESIEPNNNLTDDEADALTAFLLTLK
jgi:mono/diheme cytochrome c family protein